MVKKRKDNLSERIEENKFLCKYYERNKPKIYLCFIEVLFIGFLLGASFVIKPIGSPIISNFNSTDVVTSADLNYVREWFYNYILFYAVVFFVLIMVHFWSDKTYESQDIKVINIVEEYFDLKHKEKD